MKYLQSPPVQRFQAGGMSENPESDYYGGDEDDPSGPDPSAPYSGGVRKQATYRGSQQKLLATLSMLSKVMQGFRHSISNSRSSFWLAKSP
jgi:hypothetical protein